MTVQEGIVRPLREQESERVIILFLCACALCLLGPLTLLSAGVLYTRLSRRWCRKRERYWYTALCAVSFVFLALFFDAYYETYTQAVLTLLQRPTSLASTYMLLSFLSLPLTPFLVGGIVMMKKVGQFLRPYQTVAQWAEHHETLRAKAEAVNEHEALEEARAYTRHATPGVMYLGTRIGGPDTLPTGAHEIGIWERHNWLILNDDLLNKHLFFLGATGSGKTTAILRLIDEVLKNTARDVFLIDGKGDEKLTKQFRALVLRHREYDAPVFRLGGGRRGAKYHGFCGDYTTIAQRLIKMTGAMEAEGNATYYADENRDFIQLLTYPPAPPLLSFHALRERLNVKWLQDLYLNDPYEGERIRSLKPSDLSGLEKRLRPLIREFGSTVNEHGFTLEDTHAAMFSIDGLSVGDSAKRFCQFLIEDVKNFVSQRAQRPGLLVIDEFGVFGAENIRDLLSLARSKQWGILLATQDYANLGDPRTARQIDANTTTTLLLGTKYPEELAMTAGTKFQIESGIQRGPDGATGAGTDRIQHAVKVDMNFIRRARDGKGALSSHGYAVHIQIAPTQLPDSELDTLPPEEMPPPSILPPLHTQPPQHSEVHEEPKTESTASPSDIPAPVRRGGLKPSKRLMQKKGGTDDEQRNNNPQ